MYPVSAAYKTAIGQNVRDVKIAGTITLKDDTIINITDEDIVQGSLYVTEQCVAGEDIEVGNVYASEMGLSLSMPLENPYSLDGARIHIYFGINVGSLWEYVPLGYFYVTEIQRKANNVNLTALDGMLLFDIPVGDPGSSSPRNFVVHACEQAGVTLGTSVFEIDTFANAGVLLAAPDASKIKTCRDLLMWACQIMGAFARMNRQGELEIVPIKARASVKTISKAERFNSDVSDFAVKITKVSMQVGETVYSRGTDGMTMILEENPLMTGLSESQINTVLDNLLAQITTAVYVPFNSNFIGDPALQPGDFVTLADTSVLGGGDVASIITHSTWRYRGPHNIKGAGKHGLVRGVQNQQMKAVSSIVAIARAAQDLALAANQSTQLIKDAIGGHVLIRREPGGTNEILIMDHPDPEQAVKIWRWNMGGLGYSDNCVGADNPDREYEIAMTMDGAINANFIKTGQLDAGVVRIGPETTFAPGYDPSQIEGASAVGMGVDADCLGLWHFDGSLNSHKGVPVESNADYNTGLFGQALNIATGKHLKVPAVGLSASQGTISFRAKNLAESVNGSVLVDLPDNAGNQGMLCGIADDGKLFIEEAKLQFQSVETSQADFQTGTLSGTVATSSGNLELARDGMDFTYVETTQADFQSGTLTDVVATSAGDLELATLISGDISTGKESGMSASSMYSLHYSPDNLVDGSIVFGPGTHFGTASGATFPQWHQIDLGDVFNIDKVRWIDNSITGCYPKDYTIAISETGAFAGEQTVVVTKTGNAVHKAWVEHTFNPTKGRYVRMTVSASAAGSYYELSEWQIYGSQTKPFGTRIKEVDISGANPAGGTKIEWSKTTPTGTTVTVETALSLDGGSTYGTWQEATNGGSIPGITTETDLSNARLKIRETLSTTDTSKTPQLHSLSIYIYAPYKSSGYRYKEYDISNVGKVGSSRIAWESNVPANTTLIVKAAISTDGGSTYGSWQACTSGQAIPGLTQGMDISNARLKVQEELTTSDGTKTPQLQELTIDVGSNVQTAYGPNKSTLTAWDSISLAWKPERLSLVVNDEEACYIENPGLPASLGSHVFIGTDRNGANAINTLVDELRIDKVYREVNIRTGWHKTGVPFYTSEDMKQWPGYVKVETDGLKVYDSTGKLRGVFGSWIWDAIRQYGIQIIEGLILATEIRTGAAGAKTYITLKPAPTNAIEMWTEVGGVSKKQFEITSQEGYSGAIIHFRQDNNFGTLIGYDADRDFRIFNLYPSKSGYKQIHLSADDTRIGGNLYVNGSMSCSGAKPATQTTENYGLRYMYAVESPELKYYDSGVANLQNGEATIYIDPIFLECIEPDTELTPWQIWVQCYGENDVYVSEVGENYFKVKERNGGNSNNKVVWRFEAVRKGYAGIRLMEVTN